MELMNKTRVTDSLAVVIGPESIEVLVTEGFLFAFAKVNKQNWFNTALYPGVLTEKVGV